MREKRLSGSEGGGARAQRALSLPLSLLVARLQGHAFFPFGLKARDAVSRHQWLRVDQ
jgi:hypothetical protein